MIWILLAMAATTTRFTTTDAAASIHGSRSSYLKAHSFAPLRWSGGASSRPQRPTAASPDPFLPYVPVASLQHHQHMAAAVQQQYYHQRQIGHFGSPPGGPVGPVGFEHGFLARAQPQPGMHRMVGAAGLGMVHPPPLQPPSSYSVDLESGAGGGGRRVLTLFPDD